MKHLNPAIRIFLFLTMVTGLAYPLLITGVGHLLFTRQASGDILVRNGRAIGARMIGQKFASARYFWGRPSSGDDNSMPSGGSNLGPTSAALQKAVRERAAALGGEIPRDLLFASASGLDPEISPEAAFYQVARVAKERGWTETQKLRELVVASIAPPDWGFLGEPRVNVLQLNLKLDELQ
jgi:K+-transporting ATPase ATPase C chain